MTPTVEGEDVLPDRLYSAVDDLGGSLDSVDEVACSESLVEKRATLQD